jgi:hypothetical protein
MPLQVVAFQPVRHISHIQCASWALNTYFCVVSGRDVFMALCVRAANRFVLSVAMLVYGVIIGYLTILGLRKSL